MLSWNLGALPAGTGVTVNLPPRVAASAAAGSLILFEARVVARPYGATGGPGAAVGLYPPPRFGIGDRRSRAGRLPTRDD